MDSPKQTLQAEQLAQHGSRRTPGAMPTLSQILCDDGHTTRHIDESAHNPTNVPANEPAGEHADNADNADNTAGGLTRRNLKTLNTERRRESARRRGRSTASPSPDLHSYCGTVTTAHLPPRSQRLILNNPGRTTSEIERSIAAYQQWCADHGYPTRKPESEPPEEWCFGGARPAAEMPSQMSSYSPPSQRLIRKTNAKKRTSTSISRSLESYQRWREEVANRPPPSRPSYEWAFAGGKPDRSRARPADMPSQPPQSQPPQSPPPQHHPAWSLPRDTYSGLERQPNQPPVEGMILYHRDGYFFWDYPPPDDTPVVCLPAAPKSPTPPPCPPTSRPDIPRQQEAADAPDHHVPGLPTSFPAYHCTHNMNEIAAYLANASYVTALGGPPLADLKYGVIIVPAGEESLLFGPKSNFVVDQAFVDAIDDAKRDYGKALRMHDPEKDSEEFVRHRFDDDFPSVSAGEQQNVETILPSRETDEVPPEMDDESAAEDEEEPRGKRQRRAPRGALSGPATTGSGRKATRSARAGSNARGSAKAAADKSKPRGVSKTKRSAHTAEILTPIQPAVKRTPRGRR